MAIEYHSPYIPNKWQNDFHATPEENLCLVGAKGSGKSRGAIEELLVCAFENPGSTYIIGRKTLPSLKDSTWKDFINVVPDNLIKSYNKTDRVVTLINGSEFLGRPLDEPKKFDSLQISGFMIDEADEVEKDVYDTLRSRVRQLINVDGKKVKPRYRSILVLNPCEEDHWIPNLFTVIKPVNYKIFFSTTFDNVANLPDDYVEKLKSIYSPEMQMRMLYGQFGKVHKGKPVFPQFNKGNYIRPIPLLEKAPIFRGIDFGFRRPACVWVQFNNGQLRILASKLGKDIYLDDFVKEVIFPMEKELFYEHKPGFKTFCDPAGSQESDKGRSSIQILQEHGIQPLYRRTKIEEGIKAVKHYLDTVENNEPNFIIHPRCTTLIEGFRGGYHRLDNENDPHKDGYYEHEFDALRYCAWNLYIRHKSGLLQGITDSQKVFVHPHTGRRIQL